MQLQSALLSYRGFLWLVVCVMTAATIAVGAAIWSLRSDAIEDAIVDAHSMGRLLAEQTTSSMKAIEIVFHDLQSHLDNLDIETPADFQRVVATRMMHAYLKDYLWRLPQADVITIVDRDGKIVNFTRSWPAPFIDLSDRDYFKHVENNDDGETFVGAAVPNKATGAPTFYFSRRINGPNGEFMGAMLIGIGLDYFRGIYEAATIDSGWAFMLMRRDGTVLIRYPGPLHSGDRLPVGWPWYQKVAEGGGTYFSPGAFEPMPRWIAVEPLKDYPLVVNVAVPMAAALASWYRRAATIGSGAAIMLLCLGSLLKLLLNKVEELTRSQESLAKRSRELESANIKFDNAINNLNHGMCMFDAEKRLVVCNDIYATLYRLPPELLNPGTPHRAIISHRVLSGVLSGARDQEELQQHMSRLEGLPAGESSTRIERHADGRLIRIVREPTPQGGWVATHEDITERHNAEQKLDETKKFLDTIIKNIPLAVVVKDAKTRRYVLVNRAFEKMIDARASDLIGRTVFDVHRTEDAALIDKADRDAVAAEGSGVSFSEIEVKLLNGSSHIQATNRIVIRDGAGSARYIIAVIEDVTERRKVQQRIEFLAHHDVLTGLANRAALIGKIEEAANHVRRFGATFNVLLLDLDRFKQVNDTLGHFAGDALLIEVAARLKGLLRHADVLARLGGDEFAIVQSVDGDPRPAADMLAHRIIDALGKPFRLEDSEVSVGTSIGIAVAPEHALNSNDLLKMADLALYRAKAGGRNGYRFFDPEMSTVVLARHEMEIELRRAIEQDELCLHYQPIIDARTRKICEVEALIRWHHPTKGFIFPDRFIPLAEESGLIAPIGEWALRRACAEAAAWPRDVRVAVNLSPLQLRNENLAEIVARACADASLPPDRLALEITETALIESPTEVVPVLRQLKNLGVTIALDDFGTGYSSLSQLAAFPFDKIKIDRSFVKNMTKQAECAAIISATLTLAHSLDIGVTAEGVETIDQFRLLQLAGVSSLQGYLFERPRPASECDFNKVYAGFSLEDAA